MLSFFKIRKIFRYKSIGPILVVLALAVYLLVAWLIVTDSYKTQPQQNGLFASSQTYTSQDYSKSLDLRITAKAKFQSSAITKIKELGITQGVNVQTISFAVTTDNLNEYALMMTPTSPKPADGYPTIILCHGYYNPQQYSTTLGYLNDMMFYAKHGYVVIKPDFRGQGLSIHQGAPDGAYYSTAYNTDVMSLITAVGQTSYLSHSNINLWGHSMGAYVALRAAVLSPSIKNVILLSGPIGEPSDMYADYFAVSDKNNAVALRQRSAVLIKYGTPITNPNFWKTTAPINYVGQLKARVQINVGSADKLVPPKFSAQLDQALNQAGKGHQYFVYEGGAHGLLPERQLIWDRSLSLLNKP